MQYIFFFRNRDAKELYKIYTTESAQSTSAVKLPQTFVKPTGALTDKLRSEREARFELSQQRMTSRHSRFTGQFVVPSALGGVPQSKESNIGNLQEGKEDKIIHTSRHIIVSNPFAKVFNRPDGPRRSEKRSAPFNVVSICH